MRAGAVGVGVVEHMRAGVGEAGAVVAEEEFPEIGADVTEAVVTDAGGGDPTEAGADKSDATETAVIEVVAAEVGCAEALVEAGGVDSSTMVSFKLSKAAIFCRFFPFLICWRLVTNSLSEDWVG